MSKMHPSTIIVRDTAGSAASKHELLAIHAQHAGVCPLLCIFMHSETTQRAWIYQRYGDFNAGIHLPDRTTDMQPLLPLQSKRSNAFTTMRSYVLRP